MYLKRMYHWFRWTCGDEDFFTEITRRHFEESCEDLFKKIIINIENTLEISKLNKYEIEYIIFEGDCYIVKIQEIIKDFFDNAIINKGINQMEINAYGATLIQKIDFDIIEKTKLINEIPLSLGIDKGDGIMDFIFPKITKIPCLKKFNLKLTKDNKSSFILKIYEGERKLVKYNKYLGKLELNITHNLIEEIEIIFEIDDNEFIYLKMKEIGNNNIYNSMKMKYDINKNDEEIKRLIDEGEKYNEDDLKEIKEIKMNLELEENKRQILLLKEENKKLKEEINELKKNNNELNKLKENSNKEINELIRNNNELNNKLKRKDNEYNEINTNYKSIILKMKKLENEINKYKSGN